MATGKIHSVETCGTVDGPGIRYVVFFQGCPLRCKYCHNPDTWNMAGGKETKLDELIKDIKKYKSYMLYSKGGVTASGGEPLMQSGFVKELFMACHKNKINTALDTAGSIFNEDVKEVLEYTDLVLLDIKSIDAAVYSDLTNYELEPTLKFAKYLSEKRIKIWLRYVLVPNLTDNLEHVEKLAEFAVSLGNVEKVDVLPFHKMGEYKWKELGLEYTLGETQPPDSKVISEVKAVFTGKGLKVN